MIQNENGQIFKKQRMTEEEKKHFFSCDKCEAKVGGLCTFKRCPIRNEDFTFLVKCSKLETDTEIKVIFQSVKTKNNSCANCDYRTICKKIARNKYPCGSKRKQTREKIFMAVSIKESLLFDNIKNKPQQTKTK